MYRVLVADKLGQDGLDVLEHADDVEFDVKPGLSEDELIAVIGDYDGLVIRSGTQVPDAVLAAATNLRVVGRAGVGIDNVDVKSATRRGVVVLNTPAANTVATAEHTMALMLAAARNVAASHGSLAAGEWNRSAYSGHELSGKTLGVMGFGRVGRRVAGYAQAFGMKVLAYDPYVSEAVARDAKVELVGLNDVLGSSDFLTLHMSLTEDTLHIINEKNIAKMKPTAVIINAARGGLIDEQAAVDALDADLLRAIAVDVYPIEPPEAANPLVGHPKVTHTPHLGASTLEAQRDVAVQVAQQVLAVLRGETADNTINMAGGGGAAVSPFVELGEKLGRLQFAMADGTITAIEIEVKAPNADELVRPVASGILKGLLDPVVAGRVNYVNAPVLAEEHGIKISRSVGIGEADYHNLITTRVFWAAGEGVEAGERLISGVVFGHSHPRVVQVSDYFFEADPSGVVLLMLNKDVPGVIGEVGSVLGANGVNIAEWRLGRDPNRHEALSFINLDAMPSSELVHQLQALPAVSKATVVEL